MKRAELFSEMNLLLDNGEALQIITSFVKLLAKNTGDDLRKGWEAAAKQQHADGEDQLVIPDVLNEESMEGLAW